MVQIKEPANNRRIADDTSYLLEDNEDDVFIIASQQAEELDRDKNGQLAKASNLNYSSFKSNAAGTSSTQFNNKFFKSRETVRAAAQTGYTEKIQNELFVDLTMSTTGSHVNDRAALQNKPEPSVSSQKENMSSHIFASVQTNHIKALKTRIERVNSEKSSLADKLQIMDNEAAKLRRDKKSLEEQIRAMKWHNAKDAGVVRDHLEKEKELKELKELNDNLKEQLKVKELNKFAPPIIPQKSKARSKTQFLANLGSKSLSTLDVSAAQFDYDDSLQTQPEPVNIAFDRKASDDVILLQMKLAQLHAAVLSGGQIDESSIERIFDEASTMLHRIDAYVDYLKSHEDKQHHMTNVNCASLTECANISIPLLRDKLTKLDAVRNTLNKDRGFLSVFQVEKLYPEELCSKPRRVIAMYATIAKSSRKFSEKMLEKGEDGSLVDILVKILEDKIAESDNVYDYFGFAIASAQLLEGLGSHYGDYEGNVDDTLLNFLRALLHCRCESPVLMLPVSRFLSIMAVKQAPLISKLCVNYKNRQIVVNDSYKFCCFPDTACTFELFFMYLLTAFTFDDNLNRYETEILLETTLNLNIIASKIQEIKPVLLFLDRKKVSLPNDICKCFSVLTSALLLLNHLSQSYRNVDFTQIAPLPELLQECPNDHIKETTIIKSE